MADSLDLDCTDEPYDINNLSQAPSSPPPKESILQIAPEVVKEPVNKVLYPSKNVVPTQGPVPANNTPRETASAAPISKSVATNPAWVSEQASKMSLPQSKPPVVVKSSVPSNDSPAVVSIDLSSDEEDASAKKTVRPPQRPNPGMSNPRQPFVSRAAPRFQHRFPPRHVRPGFAPRPLASNRMPPPRFANPRQSLLRPQQQFTRAPHAPQIVRAPATRHQRSFNNRQSGPSSSSVTIDLSSDSDSHAPPPKRPKFHSAQRPEARVKNANNLLSRGKSSELNDINIIASAVGRASTIPFTKQRRQQHLPDRKSVV